jgi:hypothetical protein
MPITLGNYQFHIVGRKTIREDDSHVKVQNRDKKSEPYDLVYIQTRSITGEEIMRTNGPLVGKPLIFAVYMSQSQMGFCRFASFNVITTFDKGRDYAQTTLINFKLGEFIINQMQNPEIIVFGHLENPYIKINPDSGDILIERAHLKDETRITQIANFGHAVPPQTCGKITADIQTYLQNTSTEIKEKFPTMTGVESVCPHSYSTSFASVNGHVFKIILQSARAQEPIEIEIFLYKYTVTFTSGETESGTIPVLMKMHTSDPEDITEMGTYANYITSFGAYICKLFEYTIQLPRGIPSVLYEVSEHYSFVGRLYNGLYPSEHLQTFLQSSSLTMSGASKKSHRRHSRIGRRHMYHKWNTNKNIKYKMRKYKKKRTYKRRK